MFRIAHLSDVHLNTMPEPQWRQLLSKRVTGYVNWRRHRAHAMTSDHLQTLVADMKARAPDHIAVTGDLTNIALPGEFQNAFAWLETLGPSDKVTVIPGNHDAYVPGADKIYRRLWAPWMLDDRQPQAALAQFPFLRRLGRIALIGVSTAVPSVPFSATGRIGTKQMSKLKDLLQETGKDNLFRIVLLHHPPRTTDVRRTFRRLTDAGRFRKVIAGTGAELVLHGHDHVSAVTSLNGPEGAVPVVGVPSASGPPAHGPKSGGYALHDISGDRDNGFRLAVTLRTYDEGGRFFDAGRHDFDFHSTMNQA